MWTRIKAPALLLLLLVAIVVFACSRKDTPVAAPDPISPLDDRLVGTWYTPAKYSAAASEGYQIGTDGKVFRLVVDRQNKLQYDPLADPGEYSTPSSGICTFTFTNKTPDSVQTFTQTWVYQLGQNDSLLTLTQYPLLGPGVPNYATRYVRTNLGEAVR